MNTINDKTFLLPFSNFNDLIKALSELKGLQKKQQQDKIATLKANGVKFVKTKGFGLDIDLSTMPKELSIKDVISYDEKRRIEVYNKLGIKEI